MYDLKCKRENCIYNCNCNCTAKDIDVSKSTECKTYEPADHKKQEVDKIPVTPTRNQTCVSCKADCLFNSDCKCVANGITVKTSDSCPCCQTYMPK